MNWKTLTSPRMKKALIVVFSISGVASWLNGCLMVNLLIGHTTNKSNQAEGRSKEENTGVVAEQQQREAVFSGQAHFCAWPSSVFLRSCSMWLLPFPKSEKYVENGRVVTHGNNWWPTALLWAIKGTNAAGMKLRWRGTTLCNKSHFWHQPRYLLATSRTLPYSPFIVVTESSDLFCITWINQLHIINRLGFKLQQFWLLTTQCFCKTGSKQLSDICEQGDLASVCARLFSGWHLSLSSNALSTAWTKSRIVHLATGPIKIYG